MWHLIISFIGWILITSGIFFIISAVVGIIRFPDFYSRLHASGVSDSCGIPMTLIGLACIQNNPLISTKLLFLAILVFIISPTSTHTLIKAAYANKISFK